MKLAFGASSRVGKDTAADIILRYYNGKSYAFADPLRDIMSYAQTVAGFPVEKDRSFLRWIGTEWGRNKSPNVWIDHLLKRVRSNPTPVSIVTDVRFRNEFDVLKSDGWTMVRITRIGAPEPFPEEELCHGAAVPWDYVIENNGTLEEFSEKVLTMAATVHGPQPTYTDCVIRA